MCTRADAPDQHDLSATSNLQPAPPRRRRHVGYRHGEPLHDFTDLDACPICVASEAERQRALTVQMPTVPLIYYRTLYCTRWHTGVVMRRHAVREWWKP